MKNINNIDDVLNKIEDIRSSLKFGDEILPLLSDLFMFLKDTIPLMLEANVSIKDSTNKIPTATENIESVSKTTETATHEVMDRLDSLSESLSVLHDSLSENNGFAKQVELIEKAQNDTTEIVYALQFQDIVSQQLEHTNRILSAVYNKFMDLFNSFIKMKNSTTLGKDIISAIEKECNQAITQESKDHFEKQTEDLIRSNGISQEDIDKLFN